jgi:hypothetical protein
VQRLYIIIIIIIIFFIQDIYTYIPETNYVLREYSVAAILLLLFMVLISLVSVSNRLYYYISTFRSMCAVPHMAVFCSFIIIIITPYRGKSMRDRGDFHCIFLPPPPPESFQHTMLAMQNPRSPLQFKHSSLNLTMRATCIIPLKKLYAILGVRKLSVLKNYAGHIHVSGGPRVICWCCRRSRFLHNERNEEERKKLNLLEVGRNFV